jgi:ABC-2 type transport system permease protein
MINWNYISKIFRDHLLLIIFAFILVGVLQFLIITLVATVDILNIFQVYYHQLAPQIQQLIGEEFMAQFSLKGAVAFGYNHPLVLIFLTIIAVILPSGRIAGEIENGTLELLFSLPVKRSVISLSLWLFSGIALLIVVSGCFLGTFSGMLFFPETRVAPLLTVAKLGLNLWLLMLLINAYAFLISSFAREGGKAAQYSAIITLFFYFLNYAAKIWTDIDFLQPLNIFYYYQPQKIMMGTADFWRNIVILGIPAIAFGLMSVRRITVRDIPG